MMKDVDLPEYPDMREISLEDSNFFLQEIFSDYRPQISEYTFTNLWVWRRSKPTFISQFGNTILILRNINEDWYLLPPIGGMNVVEIYEKRARIDRSFKVYKKVMSKL